MRIGIIVSLLLHAAILAWALIELKSTRALEAPEVVPITVELLDITDKQDLRKGSAKAKIEPTKVIEAKPKSVAKPEKEKERIAALPPPKEEPKKVEPKKEEPKKEEPKKEEPKKEEVKKPELKVEPKVEPKPVDPVADLLKKEEAEKAAEKPVEPKVEPKKEEPKKEETKKIEVKKEEPKKEVKVAEKSEKKPGKAKEKFDADALNQLLNKIPNASAKSADETDAVDKAEVEQKSIGGQKSKGQQLSVLEKNAWIAQIKSKLNQCWSPPAGGLGAEKIAVPLRFELKPDGSIVGQPRIVTSSGDPMFQIAAEAAVRALFQCEPYDMFPPDKYDLWKSWVLNFRPGDGVF